MPKKRIFLALTNTEKYFLENKTWYRIFKVLGWFFIIVLTMSAGIAATSENEPRTNYVATGEYIYDTDSVWDEPLPRRGTTISCGFNSVVFKAGEDGPEFKKTVSHCPDGAKKYAEVKELQRTGSWADALGLGVLATSIAFAGLWLSYAILRRVLVYIIYKDISEK